MLDADAILSLGCEKKLGVNCMILERPSVISSIFCFRQVPLRILG